jgi:CHAT domain-containing protein
LGTGHIAVAQSASNLAHLYERQGRIAEALPLARRAASILRQREAGGEERDAGELALGARPERRYLTVNLSIASRSAAANSQEAPALIAEALEVAQLASVSSAGQALARTAVRYAAGNSTLAELARERQDAADRRSALDKGLIAAIAKPPAQRGADRERRMRAEIEALGKKIAGIDARLRREFPQFAELSRPEPLALNEAQALLAPDEALLVFVVADDDAYRFVLRKDRADFSRIGVRKADLNKLVAAVRAGVEPAGGKLPRFDAAGSHELYVKLLASAAPLLAGANRLLIVPDGPLTGLPFSVLATKKPTAGSGDFADYRRVDWLARHYAISVLPTVASLKALRVLAQGGGKAPLPFAGFGDPVLQGRPGDARGRAAAQLAARGTVADVGLVRQLEPLPESTEELDRLAKALGGKDVFVRAEATERRVKALDLSKYRVLAFATHAIMAGEFKGFGEPALVLTPPERGDETDDGLLSASEVAGLKLNAEWVVLSACNTAAPDGTPGAEGLSGLAKAFFYAGSRALLVSHWPVVSHAAVRLSTGAFDTLAKEPGIGRAEALRRSMLGLLDDPKAPAHFAHPAVWAPFSLVGEGGAGR